MELTKEEKRAIKRGYAYRSWRRRNWLTGICGLLWIFGGMFLVKISALGDVIYFIGVALTIFAEFYNFKGRCWQCPRCQAKLPKIERMQGYVYPFLEKNCYRCGLDLTIQRKEECKARKN